MNAYGIRGNILRWFRSYLTNRSQFVSYDGRQSAIQSITCGVPQGSILGPLLFIIYMNDICNVSELFFTVLYADDTSVVIHGKYMFSIYTKELNIMFKARTYLDRRSRINLYNAYIYPYLIYCVESWGNAAKCHLDPLYILPKKLLGLILFLIIIKLYMCLQNVYLENSRSYHYIISNKTESVP